jgi:hypothetical protein
VVFKNADATINDKIVQNHLTYNGKFSKKRVHLTYRSVILGIQLVTPNISNKKCIYFYFEIINPMIFTV